MSELSLYVSASREMDPECELLGQMLAQLVPSVRWSIKRTPIAGARTDPDWSALQQAQFYVILVGSDITAPIGVEHRACRLRGIPIYAYRNSVAIPSPALGAYMRQSGADWQSYENPPAFANDLRRRLARQLIDGTPGYGLKLEELESLNRLLQPSTEDDQAQTVEDRRGAGRGGVILPNARM